MEYITVAEYASRAGVSKQTAYNRAKAPQYRGYFRKIKGVLMVDISIFEFNDSIKFNSSLENGESGGNMDFPLKGNSSKFSSVESELIETQRKQIEGLEKRIDDLFSMLAEKDSIIKDLSSNIAQITVSIQQLQHERNLIEAGKQVIVGHSEDASGLDPDDEEQKNGRKRGLFSRFRRKQ